MGLQARRDANLHVWQAGDWAKQLPTLLIKSAPTNKTVVARIRFMFGIFIDGCVGKTRRSAVNVPDGPVRETEVLDRQHSPGRDDSVVATIVLRGLQLNSPAEDRANC